MDNTLLSKVMNRETLTEEDKKRLRGLRGTALAKYPEIGTDVPEIGEGGDTARVGFRGAPESGITEPTEDLTDLESDVDSLEDRILRGQEEVESKPEDRPASTKEGAAADISNDFAKVGGSGGKPESELRYSEYKEVQDKLSRKEMEAIDPEIKKQYIDAQEKARQLYEDRENRVAWASLAETIGTGLLKLGMAQTAKEGVDVSRIPWEKPTDWESKLSRYGKQYETELDRLRRNYLESKDEAETAKGAEAKILQRQAADAKDLYEGALRKEKEARDRQLQLDLADIRRRLEERKIKAKQETQTTAQQQRIAEKEEERKLKEEKELEEALSGVDKTLFTNQITEANSAIQEAKKRYKAANTLINNLKNQKNLDPKNREALAKTYGKLAGEAGIDLDVIFDQLEQAEPTLKERLPEEFGGESKEALKERKAAILNSVVGNAEADIEDAEMNRSSVIASYIRKTTDRIKNKSNQQLTTKAPAQPEERPAAPAAAPTAPAKPAGPKLVKVKGPSGQVAEMTEDNAKKYLGKKGYSRVE